MVRECLQCGVLLPSSCFCDMAVGPHQHAGHVTAPDQCCRNVKKLLQRRRPHVTKSRRRAVNVSCSATSPLLLIQNEHHHRPDSNHLSLGARRRACDRRMHLRELVSFIENSTLHFHHSRLAVLNRRRSTARPREKPIPKRRPATATNGRYGFQQSSNKPRAQSPCLQISL